MIIVNIALVVGSIVLLALLWLFERARTRSLWHEVLSFVPRVFLSYRRNDLPHLSALIRNNLMSERGIFSVFRDVEDIEPGAEFEASLTSEISQASTVFVLIGPDWEKVERQGRSTPAYQEPDDWIKAEVETALRLGIQVVPVLVDRDDVPSNPLKLDWLKLLLKSNAIHLRSLTLSDGISQISDCAQKAFGTHKKTDQRVNNLMRTWQLAASPKYLLTILCIAIALLLVSRQSQISEELSKAQEQIDELVEGVDKVDADLDKSLRIFPFTLDEFERISTKATSIPENSLMISDVVVFSLEKGKSSFVSSEPFEPGHAKINVAEDLTSENFSIGQKLRIAIRTISGSGKTLDAKLIQWWELEK